MVNFISFFLVLFFVDLNFSVEKKKSVIRVGQRTAGEMSSSRKEERI